MKKIIKRSLALVMALVLSVTAFSFVPVSAEEDDYSPISWYPVVKNSTKTYTGKTGNQIIANTYFERKVLLGFDKGISKINKALKKLEKSYDPSSLHATAKEMADESNYSKEILYDCVTMDVSYCGMKYICLVSTEYWYGGGVSNDMTSGYVYDLNTGKKKTITQVTGLSEKVIKSKIVDAIKSDEEFKDYIDEFGPQIEAMVNATKVKDINFVVEQDGSITVLILPYTEPLYGGWTRYYSLDGVTVAN